MRTSADACRVLSLDGGGAKGFYTLGVLKEIEAMVGQPICECFDLIFGTSTGGIIAGLLGYRVHEVHALYKQHVPAIMRRRNPRNCALWRRSATWS
jgi:patatin-like phospholipase/acyl hydrolase